MFAACVFFFVLRTKRERNSPSAPVGPPRSGNKLAFGWAVFTGPAVAYRSHTACQHAFLSWSAVFFCDERGGAERPCVRGGECAKSHNVV